MYHVTCTVIRTSLMASPGLVISHHVGNNVDFTVMWTPADADSGSTSVRT